LCPAGTFWPLRIHVVEKSFEGLFIADALIYEELIWGD